MSKIFKLLLIFIFITNCSFHKNSKFWNKENIEEEKNEKKTEIFKKEEKLNFEFNPNLKIELDSRAVSNSFFKNFKNNSVYKRKLLEVVKKMCNLEIGGYRFYDGSGTHYMQNPKEIVELVFNLKNYEKL